MDGPHRSVSASGWIEILLHFPQPGDLKTEFSHCVLTVFRAKITVQCYPELFHRRGPGSFSSHSPVVPSRPSPVFSPCRIPIAEQTVRPSPISVARPIPVPPPTFSAGPIIRRILQCEPGAVNWTGLNPLIEAISLRSSVAGLGASWSRRAAFDRPTSCPLPPPSMQSGETH